MQYEADGSQRLSPFFQWLESKKESGVLLSSNDSKIPEFSSWFQLLFPAESTLDSGEVRYWACIFLYIVHYFLINIITFVCLFVYCCCFTRIVLGFLQLVSFSLLLPLPSPSGREEGLRESIYNSFSVQPSLNLWHQNRACGERVCWKARERDPAHCRLHWPDQKCSHLQSQAQGRNRRGTACQIT